ncbi:MAG: hypothetical protein HZY76_02795 [Anaerolineae bacterium]|nr:MAG: hypothetical protein HZY76_02795 [Anaerolineae bacterium]
MLSVGPHADTTFVDGPAPRRAHRLPRQVARGSPPAAPVSTVSPRMPSTAALASAMPSPASAAVAGAAETVNPVVLASRTIQRRADITAPAAAPPPEPPGTSNWAASVHGTHAVEALAVAPAAAAASPRWSVS